MTIRMEAAGGVISILGGADDITPPRSCELWVAGGRLIIDMTGIETMPSAVIDDLGQALLWLPHIFGDRLNDAVLDLMKDAAAAGVAMAEAPDEDWLPGNLTEAVRWAAMAEWMGRWWPSHTADLPRLDAVALAVETCAQKWRYPLLFDQERLADELEPLLPALARLIAALETGAGEAAATQIVWEAADAVCHLLDLDDPAFDLIALAHENHLLGAEPDEEFTGLLQQYLADTTAPAPAAAVREDLALAAGAGQEPEPGVVQLTVDPIQVRPRTVGGQAGNVEVFTGDDAIEITVALGDVPARSLEVRIWPRDPMPGTSIRLPAAREPLTREAWGYVAQIPKAGHVSGLDPASVDIADPDLMSAPRRQEDATRDRDFIVDLITRRRHAGQDGPDTSAVAPLLAELKEF